MNTRIKYIHIVGEKKCMKINSNKEQEKRARERKKERNTRKSNNLSKMASESLSEREI